MSAAMEYMAVEANSLKNLSSSVNDLIEQGWRPLGGLSSTKNFYETISYCQALIKEDKKDQKEQE